MSALLGLLAYAVIASLVVRRWLLGAHWASRAPGLAILAWQAVAFSVAGALVLAGAALVLPLMHWSVDLAEVFRACVAELRHQYGTPAGAGLAVAGGVAAACLVVRFVWVLSSLQMDVRATRREMRTSLALLGTDHPERGYVELDHSVPLVYCLPGRTALLRSRVGQAHRVKRGREVVVTRGAREVLTPSQLDGVLAHERAHLRARHDLAVTTARALSQTFFGIGIFAMAAQQISELVEMKADDAATAGQRRDLAAALFRLASSPAPLGAMGAGGAATAMSRIRRLAEPAAPLSRRGIAAVSGGVLTVLVVPLAIALVPTLLALFLDCCGAPATPF